MQMAMKQTMISFVAVLCVITALAVTIILWHGKIINGYSHEKSPCSTAEGDDNSPSEISPFLRLVTYK